MAKATITKAVTRTEVVTLEPERITLVLSRREAETLRIIGWHIGGSLNGRRGDVESVNKALDAVLSPNRAFGYQHEDVVRQRGKDFGLDFKDAVTLGEKHK